MLRINIENTTRAKALIEFFLSHRDVAHVLIFCIPQYTAAVAQWLERSPREREVVCSIPDRAIPKTL